MQNELLVFNHHLGGVFVILLGIITYLEASLLSKPRWVKFLWPIPLLVVGTYMLIWSDPQAWPLGPIGWLANSEVMFHKTLALLTFCIGGIELSRRTGHLSHPGWGYIFYGMLFIPGVLFLFHRGEHHSHLVYLQHIGMGTVAIATGIVKSLSDLKWRGRWMRLYLLPALIILLGLQLLLYTE